MYAFFEMTKNSCSQPTYDTHCAMFFSPRLASRRLPCVSIAAIERSSGVFSSRAIPFHATKHDGMYIVSPRTNGGDFMSHELKAAAVCVWRRPPLGNDEPSVSAMKSLVPSKSFFIGRQSDGDEKSRSMKPSCFWAHVPRIGANQWAKLTAPRLMAQSIIALAIWSFVSFLSGEPVRRACSRAEKAAGAAWRSLSSEYRFAPRNEGDSA
mmetsp:Transcript_1727/g.4399  ORF Transcript_1727/g.4399 Transcript_1727/m.4399 type:complete len:209 (+) Transcript_1727:380-1006(+)